MTSDVQQRLDQIFARLQRVEDAAVKNQLQPQQQSRALREYFKESLAALMLGAIFSFAIYIFIPGKIDSQTKELGRDVSSLRSGVEGMRSEVADTKKLVNDLRRLAISDRDRPRHCAERECGRS
jgi:hypothetical protein